MAQTFNEWAITFFKAALAGTLPSSGGGTPNADGSTNIGGVNGTSKASAANPVPAVIEVGGAPASNTNPQSVQTGALSTGANRSGTATTTSGGLTVAANTARRFLVGQNVSAVIVYFNEFGGTAVAGAAGTYTVPAGSSFSVSTQNAVNFLAATGTAVVTMTEG